MNIEPAEGNPDRRARQIYDRFLMRASRDDEFHDWAEYRTALTDFIRKSTPAGGSLLILGAGKCNDLDLGRLADHCGRITLSDYRPELAEEAWRRYGLSPSERLDFAESDYVGITDEAYVEYTRLLLEVMQRLEEGAGDSLQEAAGPQLRALLDGMERIYRDNETYAVRLGEKDYDNAVVCGVHSQLNNSFRGLFQYAQKDAEDRRGKLRFAEELNAAVFAASREHTGHLVRRFNEAVFAAVRQGVVYGYEKSILYTPKGELSPVIATVDGARQAEEAIADVPAEYAMNCLWPLSRRRGIRFEMSICYLPVNG
ncbi:MAG: hypothetical protein IJ109_05035 [Firmicutes bacterium]|nr:hypothetical protein [Bacillota bacterium]